MCVFTWMRTYSHQTHRDSRMAGAGGWGRRRAVSVYGDTASVWGDGELWRWMMRWSYDNVNAPNATELWA